MKKLAGRVKAALLRIWKKEPVRVVTVAVGAVVFVCAKCGVILPQADVVEGLALLVPILTGGEIARSKVTPA